VLGAFHELVVDEEVAAEVAGKGDVVRRDAEDDVDDPAAVGGGVVQFDADHDRGLVPYSRAHDRPA
jgi:hypothetical protein